MTPTVQVQNLTHQYGERTALNNITLSANPGEILGLLGPNGSGKTTLFRILSTLIPPTSGQVTMDGLDLATGRSAIRRIIGVVFQSPSLDKQLTAHENLQHHGHLYGLRSADLATRIQTNLTRVNLWDRKDERVERFSGGMRRRVELAKGLLTDPKILILDEPSTGLDPAARADLAAILRTLRDQGMTILLTTHLMEEADRCDRLVILDQGNLVAHDTPLNLRKSIGGKIVTLQSSNPQAISQTLREQFNIDPKQLDDTLRFESTEPQTISAKLAEAHPDDLDSITIGRPDLTDVFIRLTGHHFDTP